MKQIHLVLVLYCFARFALATPVQIPLHIDHQYIDQLLHGQVYTGKNNSIRIMDDGSGCYFVKLSNPKTDTEQGWLRITSKANVRVGTRSGNKCMLAVNWHGRVEIYNSLKLVPQQNIIQVHVEKSNLLTSTGNIDPAANLIWQNAQSFLPDTFSAIAIDLKQPIADLKAFLQQVIPKTNRQVLDETFKSLKVTSTQIVADGVNVQVDFDLPAQKIPTIPLKKQAKLSDHELQQLQTRLDALDAFLTFIIKSVAAQQKNPDIEAMLFDLLIETRYDIREVLENEIDTKEDDPVKQLFLSIWKQLRPVVSSIAAQQPNPQGLQYISFITAADALQALENLGPSTGIDISVDGLRNLARILLPTTPEDPVEYNDALDPVLQQLFKIGVVSVSPVKSGHWFNWLIQPAWADNKPSQTVLDKLNNTLPSGKQLSDYLQSVNQLLAYVVKEQLAKGELDSPYHTVYENTLFTAAWQESCWRQFVNKQGKRVPLRSRSGDVGILQINARVWRGFYDLNELKWNILYNAQAGGDILLRYMIRYAIANEEHKHPGELDNLARSTYSTYNGGPRRYNRYRLNKISNRLKKIDQLFYDKYLIVKQGDKLAVRSCLIGG